MVWTISKESKNITMLFVNVVAIISSKAHHLPQGFVCAINIQVQQHASKIKDNVIYRHFILWVHSIRCMQLRDCVLCHLQPLFSAWYEISIFNASVSLHCLCSFSKGKQLRQVILECLDIFFLLRMTSYPGAGMSTDDDGILIKVMQQSIVYADPTANAPAPALSM